MARDCWRAGAARRASPPLPFPARDRSFCRTECPRSCEAGAFFARLNLTPVITGQKRVDKGVHARLRRAIVTREFAYYTAIHLLCENVVAKKMDPRVKPAGDACGYAMLNR